MTTRPNHEPLPPGLYVSTWRPEIGSGLPIWTVWVPESGRCILCRNLTTEEFEALRDGLTLEPERSIEPDKPLRPSLRLVP